MQITCTQKEFVEILEQKNLAEYHHLYIQIDTLLLAVVFETFKNMCLKIYELDLEKFLSAPGLA